eukprot:scaffold23280_cov43-Attheya_sp.AAC.3
MALEYSFKTGRRLKISIGQFCSTKSMSKASQLIWWWRLVFWFTMLDGFKCNSFLHITTTAPHCGLRPDRGQLSFVLLESFHGTNINKNPSFINNRADTTCRQASRKKLSQEVGVDPSWKNGCDKIASNDASQWETFNQSSQLKRAGGILYRRSVLTKEEFESIKREVESLSLKPELNSVANHRLGAQLDPLGDTYSILSHGSLYQWINSILKTESDEKKMILSDQVPVDLRVYEKKGAGMEWHVDDVLFEPEPQVEVILTLDNDSDCKTCWIQNGREEILETEPNSALVLLAGQVRHKVAPLKHGRRRILKFVYCRTGSHFIPGSEIHIGKFHNKALRTKMKHKGKRKG